MVYLLVGPAPPVVLGPEDLVASSGPLVAVVEAADVGVPDRLFSLVALVAVANGALLTMVTRALRWSRQRSAPEADRVG
ncbi:hypothetical protein [Blastococcus sp. SYSU DS0533]